MHCDLAILFTLAGIRNKQNVNHWRHIVKIFDFSLKSLGAAMYLSTSSGHITRIIHFTMKIAHFRHTTSHTKIHTFSCICSIK